MRIIILNNQCIQSLVLKDLQANKEYKPSDFDLDEWYHLLEFNDETLKNKGEIEVYLEDETSHISQSIPFDMTEVCNDIDQGPYSIYITSSENNGQTLVLQVENIFTKVDPTIAKIPHTKPRNNEFILVSKYLAEYDVSFGNELKTSQQTYTINPGEQYFAFVPENYLNEKNTVFLIYTEDGVPMVEFKEVAPNLFLIPLPDPTNTFIPFRRYSSEKDSFKLGFQGQMLIYDDGTILYSQDKFAEAGHVDNVPTGIVVKKDMISKINVYSSAQGDSSDFIVLKHTFDYSDYGVIIFYTKQGDGKQCKFYQTLYEIKEEESSISPDFKSAFNCDWYSDESIYDEHIEIKCDQASAIQLELESDSDTTSIIIISEKSSNGNFVLKPSVAIKVKRITPICNSESGSYCIINKELDPSIVYLVSYPTIDGVNEESNQLGSGFKSEIIHDASSLIYTKTWSGEVSFSEMINPNSGNALRSQKESSTIKYKRTKIENDKYQYQITLSYGSDEQEIPISRKSLEEDPENVMKALGVNNYDISKISFSDDGKLFIDESLVTTPDRDLFSLACNIPEQYIQDPIIIDDWTPDVPPEDTPTGDVPPEDTSTGDNKPEDTPTGDKPSDKSSDENEPGDKPDDSSSQEQSGNQNNALEQNPNNDDGGSNTVAIVVPIVIVIIVVIAAIVVFIIWKRKKQNEQNNDSENDNTITNNDTMNGTEI